MQIIKLFFVTFISVVYAARIYFFFTFNSKKEMPKFLKYSLNGNLMSDFLSVKPNFIFILFIKKADNLLKK